jgi:hypothetical protein
MVIILKDSKYINNEFDPTTFLARSTIIAGTTGCGKSYVLNSILDALSTKLRLLIVLSGTANIDKKFPMHKYTHPMFIHSSLDIPAVEKAINKATELMEYYQKYTEPRVVEVAANYLHHLLRRHKTVKIIEYWDQLTEFKVKFKKLVNPTKTVIDEQMDIMVELCKKIITSYKFIIICKKMKIDNPVVVEVLNYIDFNPNIGIVLNDLTDEYAALSNKEKGVFNAIFNKGRHSGVTLIMLIHTWTGFGTTLRNSAHNIVFTNADLTHSYVSAQKIKGMESRSFTNALNAIIVKDRALPEKDRKYTHILFIKDRMIFMYIQADARGKQVYVGTRFS